jgi:hypothetical protein
VLVDVLDRDRGQVVALAHPGTEPGHHHRVGTQVLKHVGVNGHGLHTQNVGQQPGQRGLHDLRRRGVLTPKSQRRCWGGGQDLDRVSHVINSGIG